jgi:hypothetical protein
MPQKFVRAPKQKRTAALTSVSDLVKTFDRHRQLTLSPQLVKFRRLGSVSDSESVVKPEAHRRPSVTSNFFYKVPIKPKMPHGAIKQAASDFSQAAKDLVSTGQLSVTGLAAAGPSRMASAASMTAVPPAEGNLVDVSVSDNSNLLESAGVGTSLEWTEDDATSLLYTEEGATSNLPHHLQLQDQVPFTPVFTAEEAAASAALHTPRGSGSPTASNGQCGEGDDIPPGNFLATMEFSVTDHPTTPATVKARLPLLQARRQLPFSSTAGTPKQKKPSSSHKKGAKSAIGSLAGDSTNSDEDQMVTSKLGRKSIRDTLAVEVAALKEQLSKVQMELLNKQLETVQIVASVKSDLTQLHNQLQLYQEAHANLEGDVDRTTHRVSNNEASISDIHVKLSATDRKQEELRQALESLRAMPALTVTTGGSGPPPAHNAAFFLGGIPQLRTTLDFRPQADPMEVVSTVLYLGTYKCTVQWTGSFSRTPRQPTEWTRERWLSTCALLFINGRP